MKRTYEIIIAVILLLAMLGGIGFFAVCRSLNRELGKHRNTIAAMQQEAVTLVEEYISAADDLLNDLAETANSDSASAVTAQKSLTTLRQIISNSSFSM